MSICLTDPAGSTIEPMERLTRQQRQQLTRQRLLDAAGRLFAEQGLAVSLDDVAAAAGLTKGAVYSNFPSKEALLLELIKDRTESAQDSQAAFSALIDQSVPLPQRLAGLSRAFDAGMADATNRNFMVFMVEFWTMAMRNPRMLGPCAQALRWMRERIASGFEREFPAGALPLPTQEFAVLEMALDIGFLIQHLADPEAVPGEYYASAMGLIFGPAIAAPVPSHDGDGSSDGTPDTTSDGASDGASTT